MKYSPSAVIEASKRTAGLQRKGKIKISSSFKKGWLMWQELRSAVSKTRQTQDQRLRNWDAAFAADMEETIQTFLISIRLQDRHKLPSTAKIRRQAS